MTERARCADILEAMTDGLALSRHGQALRYRMFTPALQPGASYPLVLYLHGMGGRGHDNRAQLEATDPICRLLLPEMQAEHPCFFIAPQCPDDIAWMHPGIPELLRQIVGEAVAHGAVDPARIYIVGSSMGAFGAWNMIARYPTLFAAAMPISGGRRARRQSGSAICPHGRSTQRTIPPFRLRAKCAAGSAPTARRHTARG